MSKLYIFNPENDLALAANKAGYTPPVAAVKLRRAGATLPLWYGSAGDCVVTEGVNARWLDEIRSKFGLETELYASFKPDMKPSPWGWSLHARHLFKLRGVPSDALPSDEQLEQMRNLSHRRSSVAIATALQDAIPSQLSPIAVEADSFDEIARYTSQWGKAVAKLPWSSSGRGVIPLYSADIESQRQQLEGAIRRQGSVMLEPRYDKNLDFAVLYNIDSVKCDFEGFSVFNTSGLSAYEGNVLASTDELYQMICTSLGGNQQFDAVLDALPGILEKLIGNAYNGPIGLDMMSVRADGYSLAPAVELNLRMTMGHVCHRFYRDHVVAGSRGSFSVKPAVNSGQCDCSTQNCRISQGIVDLAQPGSDFSFIMTVE